METLTCDVLVVGGGVNGAGIARDAAGRGLSVVLCEKDDLAAHTSSASSKLIHGGLRYLEYYEFGLVRKALREREVLLKSAPHIMKPLRFVMPHDRGQRPAWMIRAGLFLYDHLAAREFLGGSQGVDLRRHPAGKPLQKGFVRGFEYADGWVDDARLVVLAALDASEHGAQILTRTACTHVQRHARHWDALLHGPDGAQTRVQARCLVNAAGPWAEKFGRLATRRTPGSHLRLIKGSHIVVPRLFEHDYAYIFQHPDGRIVFALPYEGKFTLIGTTDVDFDSDPDKVSISRDEVDYLCALARHYFQRQIQAADVVASYSGVRPILEDEHASAAAATRDFRLDHDLDGAPLLTVWGGKITTFRVLAEQAVDWIAPTLGHAGSAWTAKACLPGGDVFGHGPDARAVLEFARFELQLAAQFPWMPPALLSRYAHAYGTRVERMLSGCESLAALGPEILPGLHELEIDYLMEHEWAQTARDILWRRTKLGLHLPAHAEAVLDAWLAVHV